MKPRSLEKDQIQPWNITQRTLKLVGPPTIHVERAGWLLAGSCRLLALVAGGVAEAGSAVLLFVKLEPALGVSESVFFRLHSLPHFLGFLDATDLLIPRADQQL